MACQSRPNQHADSKTRTIVCLENDNENGITALAEYVYQTGNSSNMVKTLFYSPAYLPFIDLSTNEAGTFLYLISESNVSCFDAHSKKFLWEIPVAPKSRPTVFDVAVDSSQGSDRIFVVAAGFYNQTKTIQENSLQIYQAVGDEAVVVNTFPVAPEYPDPTIIIDSYGIQWIFVRGTLVRFNPSYASERDSLEEI